MATNIQFLRSTTKGLRPDPTRLSLGTPMVNVHPDDPGLYFRLSNDKLAKFGPIHVGIFPPNDNPVGTPGNLLGELWVDTSQPEAAWKYWDGVGWAPITSGQNVPDIGNLPPSNPQNGDFWYDLINQVLFMWNGLAWLDVQKKGQGTQGSVQFNQGGEIHGEAEFTYDNISNSLSVPKIEFNNNSSISGVHGYDNYIQFKYDGTLQSSVQLQWDVINETFIAAGNVVLGRSQNTFQTTSYNNTTFKKSVMVEGDSEYYGSLDIGMDLTVGHNATFGQSHLNTFVVESTAEFHNNVTVGNDRGDTFHSYGVSDLSGDVKIGTAGNDDDLVINSNETHINGNVKLENNATLEQWYLERLSNVEADAALQGSILQKVGNKWMPADPVIIGSQTQFRGFVDCEQPNSGLYITGDILIQHNATQTPVTAHPSWAGIAGSTMNEGQYYVLSSDNNWYAGGGSVDVAQSDWTQLQSSHPAFILNKPERLSDFLNDVANDKEIALQAGNAITITGDTLTTNAADVKTKTIGVNYAILDGRYEPLGVSVNDGAINLTGGDGIATNGVNASSNQAGPTDTIFSEDYVSGGGLEISLDHKLTLDKSLLDSWYANQAGTPANDGNINIEGQLLGAIVCTGQNASADQAVDTTRYIGIIVDPGSDLSINNQNQLTLDTSAYVMNAGDGLGVKAGAASKTLEVKLDPNSPLKIDAQKRLSMDAIDATVEPGRGLDEAADGKIQIADPPLDRHYYAWAANNGYQQPGGSATATSVGWKKVIPYNIESLPELP